ncbi:hypothetical protein ACTXT7_015104 [Hymenolepis weldensis]
MASPTFNPGDQLKMVINCDMAYYAKCLVDAPDYLSSCGTVTYGVGLTPRSAKDFARFYAVATGEPHCNGYIGQCLIRQYCSK